VNARPEAPASFRSSAARPGSVTLIGDGVREVLARRRLIAYLVRADVKKKGADTLLGNVWWIVDPLLQMAVYWVLVTVILQRDRYPDYALFVFCAILPWKWFATSIGEGLNSVVSQERLIRQIYFPKLVLPTAASMALVVNFGFGLIALLGLLLVLYRDHMTPWILLVPVVAAVQFLFSLAAAIIVSTLNVFYRDVGNLARHLLRFWFYLSPTLYGMDLIEELSAEHPWLEPLFRLNPWTYVLESYRALIYWGHAPDWGGLAAVGLVSIVLLALAILMFKRAEPEFAKVL
jgi:ABC-type polysaccharide/polyol phosphate export permease